jgi:multicomponent Na+:H+ antiporter subunit A
MTERPSRPPVDAGGAPRLPGADELDDVRRSVVLETVVRLVFHTVLVFSLYLLFAGHNQPGGGFVGGLVAGLGFVLRYLAGGRGALREAARLDASLPLGLGIVLAAGTGVAALAFGGEFLESAYQVVHLPLLGEVKATSPLLFDIGVYLVVVGLVLVLLRTLGAEAER